MPKQQNKEYKSSWHDDYLKIAIKREQSNLFELPSVSNLYKWVCGFANAQGGRIYIGKDDAATVVGLPDYKKLMEDIPNKIKNFMGITAEVNLLQEDDKYYQAGQTWDNVIEPRATFDDIDEATVKKYLRKAEETGRLPDIDGLSTSELLEKLRLAENGQLKRGAIVLFGKDPGKFYPNTFVKIGKFEDDDFTIRFQELEEGNIIQVLDKVLRTLDYKFLIRNISFEGMNRIETLEYPIPALREMLLNSLIHRNYMGAPTQIRVYDNKMFVWNDGGLPSTITLSQLTQLHSSHPRNPILAGACFLGGYIDSWGSGIMKIMDSCKAAGLPTPMIEEDCGGLIVRLFKDRFSEEQLKELGLNDRQVKAVLYVKEKGKITNSEYQTLNSVSKRTATNDLSELVDKYKLVSNVGFGAGSFYELINGQ